MPPPVTIVVPTYNRLPYLPQCLEALFNLDYPEYEIIVVDDGSTDGTKEYLENSHHKKIRIFHNEKNCGLSYSKNRGVQMAKFDFIAFTDDDCVANKNWLKFLMAGFTEEKIYFVMGQTIYIRENYQGYFPERIVQNLQARWPAGGNIVYCRKLFEKIGYFNTFFDLYHNEDSDLAIRAVDKGLAYNRAPEAKIYHQPMNWTVSALLSSARNASVWPILKKRYSKNYLEFYPPVKFRIFIHPQDYLLILLLPIVLPILLLRYLYHGQHNLKIFFAKWPVYLLWRRYYIYREALKNHVLMF